MYASYKLDGIRAAMKDGVAMSRSIKPIRNRFIQDYLQQWAINGLDGELVVGSSFQESTSGIMSADGSPDFTYYVFDLWHLALSYEVRLTMLRRRYRGNAGLRIVVLNQVLCHSVADVLAFEKEALEAGHEGIMIRSVDGPYKFGDSTEREQYLVKRKPFVDEECEIIGFEEQLQNTNELIDGERSGHLAGLVGKNTLGKFLVKSDKWGEFAVGTGQGLTKELRQQIWDDSDRYLGKLIKFKYQDYGIKNKPRLPIFLGFRDKDDL
jgi:DNA ligase-1